MALRSINLVLLYHVDASASEIQIKLCFYSCKNNYIRPGLCAFFRFCLRHMPYPPYPFTPGTQEKFKKGREPGREGNEYFSWILALSCAYAAARAVMSRRLPAHTRTGGSMCCWTDIASCACSALFHTLVRDQIKCKK